MIEAVEELRARAAELIFPPNPFVGIQTLVGPSGKIFKLRFHGALKPRKLLKSLK